MQDFIPNIREDFVKSIFQNILNLVCEYPQTSGLLFTFGLLYLTNRHIIDITTDQQENDIIYLNPDGSRLQNPNIFDETSKLISTATQNAPQVLRHLNSANYLTAIFSPTQSSLNTGDNTNSHNLFNYCPSVYDCLRNVIYINNQVINGWQYLESLLGKSALHLSRSLLVASFPVLETTYHIILPIKTTPHSFGKNLLLYTQVFLLPLFSGETLTNNRHILDLHTNNQLFDKFNALTYELVMAKRTIPYQDRLKIAQAIHNDKFSNHVNTWHWLHLQNLFSELQRLSAQNSEIDIYRLFNLSFRWLETLYLDAYNLPNRFRYDDARNMAGIIKCLIESTHVYIAEETPQISPSEFNDTSNGLSLTVGLTDLISKLIIQNHQPLNLEVLLKRTSDDVNISMKLVEAYLENHEQTINHLIYQITYFIILYAIIATCISLCLLISVINPLVTITIITSLFAIPVLTAVYTMLSSDHLSKNQLRDSEKELIQSAEQREISEFDRTYELDSLMNNIGSSIIFYENLITKILYGFIFSTLLTTLIAIPMLFLGIHMLPLIAGVITACFIGLGLFAFLNKMPTFTNEQKNKLIHNKVEEIIEAPAHNELNYLSLEHIQNTFIISSILFVGTLFNSDNPLQNNVFKMSLCRRLIANFMPVHPLMGSAILESLPLWDLLDKGVANADTHAKLKAIAEKVSNELPRNSLFNKSIGNIVDHIVELHSLAVPPNNLTDFFRTVLRLSLPYLPRLLAGTDQIKTNIANCLELAYPELHSSIINTFSQNIQNFLVSPSTDQTVWFNTFAEGILTLVEEIKKNRGYEDARLTYRRQWEANITLAAERILGYKEVTSTVKDDAILNIIQGFLEISQDALYRKGKLTKLENQTRDLLIRYSIMIEDIKYTEETQYQFIAHYQYCWKQIPKIYFPTIIVLSGLLLTMTPLSFSLPVISVLLIGGLFLLPWLTNHSHEITRVNENSFDNLEAVAKHADKDITKDAFLSPLLSDNFKAVSRIFATARLSLRQMTTATVILGIIVIGILAVTMSQICPIILGIMAATLLCAITLNILHEKYCSVPQFRKYDYYSPGVANDKYTSQFFDKTEATGHINKKHTDTLPQDSDEYPDHTITIN